MQISRVIPTQEVIGEFLRAELHSSRFREGSLRALKLLSYDSELLENPDYTNTEENEKRAKVLGLCRGWPNKELFMNFPMATQWYMATLTQEELTGAYRLKSDPSMSDVERLLSVTAEKIRQQTPVRSVDPLVIQQIVDKIEAGVVLPPVILVCHDFESKKVLLEGHSRSVAYSFVDKNYLTQGIPAILGISNDIKNWAYF